MTKPLIIVGAGMAGLLAGNLLRHQMVQMVEAQKALPNNHSAVLRFRTAAVGEALGIPFKKVTMRKATLPWYNPVADALAYSFKNTGVHRSDRSITDKVEIEERYISPPDFIQQMAGRIPVSVAMQFGTRYKFEPHRGECQVISTLPMPVLMEALDYPRRDEIKFAYVSGLNVRAKIADCDAYVTLMVPDPTKPFSRISITGDELIVEVPRFSFQDFDSKSGKLMLLEIAKTNAEKAVALLGIDPVRVSEVEAHRQLYSKITPIDDDLRKDFIYWATHQFSIFSLGRFATWRPKLLLDDLLNDIKLINSWVNSDNRYNVARRR